MVKQSEDNDFHHFVGENGWEMKYSAEQNGFTIQKDGPEFEKIIAIHNDSMEYPMGLRYWYIQNDYCNANSKIPLMFSSCLQNEFSCDDGSCIPLVQRCDKISNCGDNSDEKYCNKVCLTMSSCIQILFNFELN